jgi:hypothetical protein
VVEKLTSSSAVFLECFSVIPFLFPSHNICLHCYNVCHFKITVAVKPEVETLSLPGHSSNYSYLPLLTAKILFQSQINPCVICGRQSENGGSPLSAKFGVSLVLHDTVSSGSGIISLSVVTARPLSDQPNTTNTKIQFRKKTRSNFPQSRLIKYSAEGIFFFVLLLRLIFRYDQSLFNLIYHCQETCNLFADISNAVIYPNHVRLFLLKQSTFI